MVPYVYAGVQLVSPALFADAPAGRVQHATCCGTAPSLPTGCARVVHDGLWFHLSTPADLAEAESTVQARAVGDTR